ncbi:MAG: hypothetical protein EOL92_10340, partial [Bacteroidia bacterium]|nr:hypothetical protein [Bacteroidia bacterium]
RDYQAGLRKRLKRQMDMDYEEAMASIGGTLDRVAEMTGADMTKARKTAERMTGMLVRSAMMMHDRAVKRVMRLTKTTPLRESIVRVTQEGIERGIPVTYRDGRQMGYKEYMEMNVRTTVQHEIGEQQLEVGGNVGVVFYACNVYQDCADDHKDYQGKVYYDKRYLTMGFDDETVRGIERAIRQRNMLAVQDVRDGKPYLTTRPNCRHNLTPISLEQATDERIVNKLGLVRGSYRDDKYAATQEQRYNERQIRAYKARLDMNERMYAKSPSDALASQIARDKVLVRQWQSRQRALLRANPHLERDYRRETRTILLNDLGVKYNRGTT